MPGSKGIFWRRCIAFVIDWNIILPINFFLFVSGPRFDVQYLLRPSMKMFSAYGVLLGIAGFILLPLVKDCLFKGASIGKLICGIRVYDATTRETARLSSLILRNITFYVPFVELIVCLANKGRTLGDEISGTFVDLRNKNKIQH